MVSTSGCKISSVEDNNVVDTAGVVTGSGAESNPAVYPKFAPLNGVAVVQFGSDFIFKKAVESDGTADTGLAGTSAENAITKAIDDLDGWSTTAAIDIPFNDSIDPDSISSSLPTQNVFLIKLAGGVGNSQVDALDFAQIGALGTGAVASPNLTGGVDYTAAVISIDGGTNNVLRIYPKKPLEARTKYIVALTNGIKDSNGNAVKAAAQYSDLVSNAPFISNNEALPPLRALLQGMEKMVKGYFAAVDAATSGATSYSDDGIVFTAPITTTDPTYALRVNAAPGIFVEDEMDKYNTDIQTVDTGSGAATDLAADMALGEKLLGSTSVNAIVAGAAAAQSMPSSTAEEIAAVKATAIYQGQIRSNVNSNLATIKATFKAYVASATDKPASRAFGMIDLTDLTTVIGVPGSNYGLTNNPMVSQGYISLPQYTSTMSDSTSIWRASENVGDVFDTAFQAAAGTYPPKDVDGTTNVTYRFPFALETRDAVVPVMITTPTTGCSKPVSGWPVAIFMHGITVDRAGTLIVGNSLAAAPACTAMIAIDLPHHGIAPLASDNDGDSIINSREVFSVDHSVSAAATPWAYKIANTSELAALGIAERHEGYYLNGSTPGAITYDDAKFAAYLNAATTAKADPTSENLAALATATSDVGSAKGKSGDFFIRLDNFQRTRDNIRQSVMDLLNLNATLGDMDIDGDSTAGDFDTDKVFFIGHSLGAIVGADFVSVVNDTRVQENNDNLHPIQAAVLANPGGQLSKLLENSVSFSASLIPGLAESGLTQGSSSLEKFFATIQAHVDQGDPINYAANLADTGTPLLVFEMVGAGDLGLTTGETIADWSGWGSAGCSLKTQLCDALTAFPEDLVVPNKGNGAHELAAIGKTRVETATSYLAGTDPLIDALGLTQIDDDVDGSSALTAVVKFSQGTHGTFSSADVPATFADMMTQTISFFASNGQDVTMTGTGGVAAVPAP
ncbi:MAG: Ig-like domain-containing protein [Oceanospirillaceae bacterium]|nr:Ig-like domain-containing protein [Oceanospirillaceae bacterium]